MTRTYSVQSSFLSGVLDPRASARIETDAYNNGLLIGENVTPVHLGGVRRRGGMRYLATLPNTLTRVTGQTITAPEGGTTANANDGDDSTLVTTTTGVETDDPFVVVHYDLLSAQSILFADAVEIFSDASTSTEFRIQYSTDDAIWNDFGTAFETIDVTHRTYRRGGTVQSAQYWRVVKIGGTTMTAAEISIGEFNVWTEDATVSEVRLLPFEVSTEDQYMIALTDRSATIFADGAVVGRSPMPYEDIDLSELDASVGAEALFMVHDDYPVRSLFDDGAQNFQTTAVSFDDVPLVDFNDDSSPTPSDDVQVMVFSAGWVQGNTFQIELEGARSATVTFAGDASADARAATAANIAREVQKLFTVQGFVGVTCARTSALTYTVTFAGESANDYELMSVTPLSAGAETVTITKSASGTTRREVVWSATRGYPRTITFFEGRLYFGGTRSKKESIFGSAVNDLFNFNIEEALDGDALFSTLSGDKLNAIVGMHSGRTLELFTTGGEFRYVKEKGEGVKPSDAPFNQTSYGGAKVRPVSIDGTTLFIQRNRKSVRDFRFNFEEDAFDSLGVSSLAPHLLNAIVDTTAWNGSATDEIGLVIVVNGDGTGAVFNSRKEANVSAWTSWITSGQFKAASALLDEIYVATVRSINAVDYLFIEQHDDSFYTDGSVQVVNSPASTTVTGLDHLDGQLCRVRGDGFVLDDVTPSGGSATISHSSANVEVGLNFDPTVTPMPLNTLAPSGGGFISKRRVVKSWVKVLNTLGLLMNGDRILADRFYDIDNFDEPATPFSGNHSLEETTNWDETEDKLITFSQVDPLPFEILGIKVKMEGSA